MAEPGAGKETRAVTTPQTATSLLGEARASLDQARRLVHNRAYAMPRKQIRARQVLRVIESSLALSVMSIDLAFHHLD